MIALGIIVIGLAINTAWVSFIVAYEDKAKKNNFRKVK
jgi:hypothetical protein